MILGDHRGIVFGSSSYLPNTAARRSPSRGYALDIFMIELKVHKTTKW